jgi:hypothetical protein
MGNGTTRTMVYPVVDTPMNPEGRDYYADVRECNNYIRNISAGESAINNGVAGAMVGAALGAMVGAALGVDPGRTAMWGAASGGTSGAARGAVSAQNSKHTIVARCMSGRGYTVLQP